MPALSRPRGGSRLSAGAAVSRGEAGFPLVAYCRHLLAERLPRQDQLVFGSIIERVLENFLTGTPLLQRMSAKPSRCQRQSLLTGDHIGVTKLNSDLREIQHPMCAPRLRHQGARWYRKPPWHRHDLELMSERFCNDFQGLA